MSVNGVGSTGSVWQLYNQAASSNKSSNEASGNTSKSQDSYQISEEAIRAMLEASGQSDPSFWESSTDSYSASDFGGSKATLPPPPSQPSLSELPTEDKRSFLSELSQLTSEQSSDTTAGSGTSESDEALASLIASLSSTDLDSLSDKEVDSLFQEAIETIGPPPGPPPAPSSFGNGTNTEEDDEIQRFLQSLNN
ncbi:hypothetical protein [Cohnella fermenti]|uniref:Uncharacterized protein n=1 Tax=Cohnella fermenti TaxID=2565925 RepID=A0A4V3WEP2_9BACL|nr:hypothetical protein [Cohnella fermenti]THF77104.1 hypothetical protein E6C55_17215 [Cohnella fermenti]